MSSPEPWQVIAERKQKERQSRIPKAWLLPNLPPDSVHDVRDVPRKSGLLSDMELEITEKYDATSLAEAIRSHKYTVEAVTVAFCKRAAIAQQVTNCLTEIFFDVALKRAQWLDQEYKRTGKTLGPLHGIPVSLKDMLNVKGFDSSIGLAAFAFDPAKENALLVDLLLEQGAVLYCKTNVPQTLMALDSDNHLFGRTLNPRDRRLTAGGSTGGEGALIAMRGSLLGVGTDVGGSIRIPAMCNGLYGIKPSSERIPFEGQRNCNPPGLGSISIAASAGPLSTTMRDCELFLKTISNTTPWERDPSVAYGLWEEQGSLGQKPVIGVLRTDGLITPLPPIQKVIEESVQTLRKAGIEVVEVDAPAFKKCQALANAFFSMDGYNYVFDLLEKHGEPLNKWLSTRLKRKSPIQWDKLLAIQAQRVELEAEMLKIWSDPKTGKKIDAIICPVAPHPTPLIDRWNSVSYTSSFVLLNYPAGTLPVRDFKIADLEGEVEGKESGPWDKINRQLWDTTTVDRNIYLNSALSIQVVAPKLQEKRLVQAMTLIDDVLRKREASGPISRL